MEALNAQAHWNQVSTLYTDPGAAVHQEAQIHNCKKSERLLVGVANECRLSISNKSQRQLSVLSVQQAPAARPDKAFEDVSCF